MSHWLKHLAAILLVGAFAAGVWAESNDSIDALKEAGAKVNAKLAAYATNSGGYELLLDARKIASSMNPRGDNKSMLSALDEGSLRLQLTVLLALAKARDSHYDPSAMTNAVYMNVAPPLSKGNELLMAGMDPMAIKDSEVRKAYQDAIAENHRRHEKLKREMALSRGVDRALMDIWVFVKRGLPENSAARKRAEGILADMVPDKSILERLDSGTAPGLTW